ncbi:MAG: hypothetical protein A2600_12310 [Candidatus Lambdaproteobacteria bacterium RIFOXYD1_FULL_56_27]|uniref:TIGR04372 family glycosyltransferase n=1 Tax=Candidatus Lambdaproteobacteria bacterium RIFOXYD2_FULL_56_26 TaxID=1817773 RepID=A0A1F6GLK1_9PROT|nr:MAG: hypothetical protein A2557_02155 [Candidatus Lambdaproteobacteria bacterium RIFOXYD2_FULL_56_26]OGH02719.1 MAG: hypothetical protein A2426_07320 [Candidatus Lambdaproteobacteria bacterium RIFOXYC1_FULL_56_13]OGH08632.1 MAG: hypothetical protein A2600_12310 [Candidatus Lambdaproteobacteria bacterium RIFOXYD1_FULL_56_27]
MRLILRFRRFAAKSLQEQWQLVTWVLGQTLAWALRYTVGLIAGVGLLFVLDVIEPLYKLRLSRIHSLRIGHLALNLDLFCRRRQLSPPKGPKVHHLIVTDHAQVANRELLKLWQRHLWITESVLWRWLLWLTEWLVKKTPFWVPLPMNSVEWEEFNQAAPTLTFTEQDERRGQAELQKMGLNPAKDWFVCIFARDSGYLNALLPRVDWSRHDCRNSKIESFRPLVQWLLDQGAFVLRLGSHTVEPFVVDHPRYVDYANRFRTEWMDLYLCGKAKAFVGSASGLADVTNLFNTPRLQLDCVPFGFIPFGYRQLALPKKVIALEDAAPVPYKEVIERGLALEHNGINFARAGYGYLDNSPEEKLLATQELMRMVESADPFTDSEKALIEQAWALFPEGHPSRGIKNPISPSFIARHLDLFS